jgi:hypothetical protein
MVISSRKGEKDKLKDVQICTNLQWRDARVKDRGIRECIT